jgi:hypothetical protein
LLSCCRSGPAPVGPAGHLFLIDLDAALPLGAAGSGSTTGGTFFSSLEADQSIYSAKSAPCPNAGTYTVLIGPNPVLSGSAGIPQASGYGTVTVSTAGLASLTGKLGDGTAFSQKALLSPEGTWPMYVPLYKNTGFILGSVQFETIPGTSDFDGTVTWFKPANATSALYPGGFNIQVPVIGSFYTKPAKGTRVLNFANQTGNGMVNFGQGGLSSVPPPVTVTLSAANLVSGTTAGFSMHLNIADGLFSGAFADPATHKPRPFNGAVFQDQTEGAGFFSGDGQTGSVLFEPNP